MADGFSKVAQESFIKPVQDEVGKAVEVGVQSVAGTGQYQTNHQNLKQENEFKQKEEVRKSKIANISQFFRQLVENRKAYQQQKLQEDQLKAQQSQQDTQKNQDQKLVLDQKKQVQNTLVQEKQRSMEARLGKGIKG